MKLLYSQSTATTKPYPRKDGAEIVGLDDDYLVLTKVETTPPATTENQTLSSSYVVDVNALEYRQQWTVIDNPVVPNWDGFYDALLISDTYRYLLSQTVPNPSISGVMAVMGLTIERGLNDPSNPNRLEAFKAATAGLIGTLNALQTPLTPEQLAEVRTLLDANGFKSVALQ